MILDISVFYLLLLAHIISDFVLQSDCTVELRQNINLKTSLKGNFRHAVTHFTISVIFILKYFSFQTVTLVLIIAITHFLVDLAKSRMIIIKPSSKYSIFTFIIDQIIHFILIFKLFYLLGNNLDQDIISYSKDIISKTTFQHKIILSLLLITISLWSVGVFIRLFFKYLDESKESYFEQLLIVPNMERGTKNGGFYIGIFERLFIISAIILDIPELVGFTLATKSIARFKKFDDDSFVEKFIMGSFISFISAIITGVIIKKFNIIPK